MKTGFTSTTLLYLLCVLLPLLLFGCGGGGGSAAGTTAPPNTVVVKVSGVTNPGVVKITVTGSASFSDNCGGNGQYTFNQGSGTYVVTPSLAGYSFTPATRTVTVNSGTGAVIDFSGAMFDISGTVTATNSAGLNGAVVTATDMAAGTVAATATCDAAGAYKLAGLQNGKTYQLTPSHPLGGITFTPASRTVTPDGSDITADFSGDVAAWGLSGMIKTDAGVAVPGVTLTLSDPSVTGFSYTAVSDTTGKYAFTGVPDGYYKLSPNLLTYSYPGYGWGDSVKVDATIVNHDIQVPSGGNSINFGL